MNKQDEYVKWLDVKIARLEKLTNDFQTGKTPHTQSNVVAEGFNWSRLCAYREVKRIYLELHGGKDDGL